MDNTHIKSHKLLQLLLLITLSLLLSQYNVFSQCYPPQQRATTYNFQAPMSNFQDYAAKESIRLGPPFHYRATTDACSSFHACIKWNDFCNMEPIGYVDLSNVGYDRNINTNLPVGAIRSTFNVTPSGAATYSVPIHTPPGTAGMVPNIAVSYNSQGRNGLLGHGFDISGLSAITRVPKNLYNDGVIEPPNYNDHDMVALDGQRLVAIEGTYGLSDALYTTEQESFIRVKSYTATTSRTYIDHYIVQTKDGKTMYYGNTQDSKVRIKDNPYVIMWRLNRIVDMDGNYIDFVYSTPTCSESVGESVIEEIKYTGNITTGQAPYNTIKFYYGKRAVMDENSEIQPTDPITIPLHAYTNQNLDPLFMKQTVLLKKIVVTCESALAKTYEFNYFLDYFKYSHLCEIIEKNKDGSQAYNSTLIKWNDNVDDSGRLPHTNNFRAVVPTTNPDKYRDYFYFYGDFNGDGKVDVVACDNHFLDKDHDDYDGNIAAEYRKYYIFQNSSTDNNVSYGPAIECKIPITLKSIPQLTKVGDFNGDGLSDLATFSYDFDTRQLYVEIYYMTNDDTRFLLSNMDSFIINCYENYNYTPGNAGYVDENNQDIVIGDYNGDGLDDILLRLSFFTFDNGYSNFYGIISKEWNNNNSAFTNYNWFIIDNPNFQNYQMKYKGTIDFNGDGKADIIVGNKIFTFINNKFTLSEICDVDNSNNKINFYSNYNNPIDIEKFNMHNQFGDFNGDGKTDLLYYNNTTKEWSIAYSNGYRYYSTLSLSNIIRNDKPWESDECRKTWRTKAIDFNGDGKSDIVQIQLLFDDDDKLTSLHLHFYYFNGYSFKYEWIQVDISRDLYNSGKWLDELVYHDFGMFMDINGDGNNDFIINQLSNYTFGDDTDVYLVHNKEANLLVKNITDGMNNRININYQLLNDRYDASVYPIYPLSSNKGTMYVVKEHYNTHDMSSELRSGWKTYDFNGLRMHRRGKGMLGFEEVIDATHFQSSDIKLINKSIYSYTDEFNYAPLMESSSSYLNDELFASSASVYEKRNLNNDKNYFIAPTSSVSIDYKKGTSSKTTTEYYNFKNNNDPDFWGDVRSSTNSIYSGTNPLLPNNKIFESKTVYAYYDRKPTSLISLLETQETEQSQWVSGSAVGSLYKGSKEYKYSADKLSSETSDPGTIYNIRTNYKYNSSGLMTESSTSAVGMPDVLTTITYDSKSRFPVVKTNKIGQFATYTYDPIYGNVLVTTDFNGLRSENVYDNNGSKTREKSIRGIWTDVACKWLSYNDPDINCDFNQRNNPLYQNDPSYVNNYPVNIAIKYYITTSTLGVPKKKSFYNSYGQLFRTTKETSNNKHIAKDYLYDVFGNTIRESMPFFMEGKRINSTITVYDQYQRPISVKLSHTDISNPPSLRDDILSEYEYGTNTVTVKQYKGEGNTDNKVYKSTTKEHDAAGRLIKVSEYDDNESSKGYVTYHYNNQNLQDLISVYDGNNAKLSENTITYDARGNRISLTDADAGTTTYEYNNYNELIAQTDAKGNRTELRLDQMGRTIGKYYFQVTGGKVPKGYVNYNYINFGNGSGQVSQITSSSFGGASYMYNCFGDVIRETKVIPVPDPSTGSVSKITHSSTFEYDDYGRLTIKVPPSGIKIYHSYNNIGRLCEVKALSTSIWKLKDTDENGRVISSEIGSIFQHARSYDHLGYLKTINCTTSNAAQVPNNPIINYNYTFELGSSNLLRRENRYMPTSGMPYTITEDFTYDYNDRLLSYDMNVNGTTTTKNQNYNADGTIDNKTDIGDYQYQRETGQPEQKNHKLRQISPPLGADILQDNQNIYYNVMNKTSEILEEGITTTGAANIFYGFDEQRNSMYILNQNTGFEMKRIYDGDFEIEKKVGCNERKIQYISGGEGICAAIIKEGSSFTIHYLFRDHLGSVAAIAAASGAVERLYVYDPWGLNRSPDKPASYKQKTDAPIYDIIPRGFTMHEHLEKFGLINMNGRIYDPTLGMFLAPDNYVQADESVAGYNRYAYCMNNPLKYTDPSGEFIFGMFVPVIGHMLDAACWGAVMGGATYSASTLLSGNPWTWSGLGNAMGHGAIQGQFPKFNFGSGLFPSMAAGALNGAYTSALDRCITNLFQNKYLFGGAFDFNTWGASAITSGIIGGLNGFSDAERQGKNVWWGGKVGKNRTQWSFNNSDLPDVDYKVQAYERVEINKNNTWWNPEFGLKFKPGIPIQANQAGFLLTANLNNPNFTKLDFVQTYSFMEEYNRTANIIDIYYDDVLDKATKNSIPPFYSLNPCDNNTTKYYGCDAAMGDGPCRVDVYDNAYRNTPCYTWRAETSIMALSSSGNWSRMATISWGFTVDINHVMTLLPLQLNVTPTEFHFNQLPK